MPEDRRRQAVARAAIEISFILFLFYANLLMGEYTHAAPPGKSLWAGLSDICTYKNFGIGLAAASAGYVVFEWLRKQA